MKSFDTECSKDYLKNLLSGDREMCLQIANSYLEKKPSIKDLYEYVFKPALYEVGKLWETNKISVADEHMATAITEGILNQLFEQLISDERTDKTVIVACVEDEKHQVGIKMVGDIFESLGWDSYFLGSGLPLKELTKFIDKLKPDMLAISLSVYHNYSNLINMLDYLSKKYPYIAIIVGGQGLRHIDIKNDYPNIKYFEDLFLLENYLTETNQ